MRLHAALAVSVFAHAAVLLHGPVPSGARPNAPAASTELAVSFITPAPSASVASPRQRHVRSRNAKEGPINPLSVTPAKAGVQETKLDPRFRRNDKPPMDQTIPSNSFGNNSARLATPSSVERSVTATESPDEGAATREAHATDEHSLRAQDRLAAAAPAANDSAVDIAAALNVPRIRFAPPPEYPDEARWEGREGRVVLRFRLRAGGEVGDARVMNSSGHADLDAEALATLSRWTFEAPEAVRSEAWYRHAFRFALR